MWWELSVKGGGGQRLRVDVHCLGPSSGVVANSLINPESCHTHTPTAVFTALLSLRMVPALSPETHAWRSTDTSVGVPPARTWNRKRGQRWIPRT